MQGKNNPAFIHGYASTNHPLYYIYYTWCSIKQRCANPNTKSYPRYGGRGIKICEEWKNDFQKFASDMGEKASPSHSIDRINNDGDYCKTNCRWATRRVQMRNQSTNIFYEYKNENLAEVDWSRKLNIPRNKFKWWAEKKGIEWVVNNLDSIKTSRRGLSNEEYRLIGEENKRRTTHGAYLPGSPLKTSYRVFMETRRRYKGKWEWKDFLEFINEMGVKPENKRLIRKDKLLPFNKDNCFWG